MKTKYGLMLDTYYGGKVFCEYSPFHIYIEPTSHCNLCCSHCPQRITKRKKGFMDLDLYRKLIDQCNEVKIEWVYLFHLGESSLDKNLPYMVDYAHEKGIKVRLNTNGTNDVSDINVDSLHISANESDVEKIKPNIDKLIQKGIDFKIDVIEGVNSKVKELYKDYVYDKNFYNWQGIIRKDEESRVRCSHPFKSFIVFWDGRCVPCCVDYDGAYIIGDANKESLEEIWNSKKMQAIRKYPVEMCRFCNLNRIPDTETKEETQQNETK